MKQKLLLIYNISIISILLFCFEFLSAQTPGVWQSYGPSTGLISISKLMGNPLNSKEIYAVSDRVYKSSDFGLNWAPAESPFNNGLIDLILINNILYASTNNGIFNSIDGGVTWAELSTFFTDKIITTIIAINNIFLIGTKNNGVFRSSDGGLNWIQTLKDSTIISFMKSEQSIYVLTKNYFSGLLRSTNGGVSWQPIQLPSLGDIQITTIISAHDTLYAGTVRNGIFRSADGGKNWAQGNIQTYPQDVSLHVTTMSSIGKKVFAGTILTEYSRPMDPSLHVSEDGGLNWTLTSLRNVTVITIYYINGILYIGTDRTPTGPGDPIGTSDGIYFSLDLGKTWNHANKPMDNKVVSVILYASGNLFAGTESSGILRSFDDGENWFATNNSNLIKQVDTQELIISPNYIVTYSDWDGLFVSRDGGFEWTRALAEPVSAMIIKNDKIFASTREYALETGGFVSPHLICGSDWGVNWSNISYQFSDKVTTFF